MEPISDTVSETRTWNKSAQSQGKTRYYYSAKELNNNRLLMAYCYIHINEFLNPPYRSLFMQ